MGSVGRWHQVWPDMVLVLDLVRVVMEHWVADHPNEAEVPQEHWPRAEKERWEQMPRRRLEIKS